jgi:4-hydroxyacetophenone monooxygenase
MAMRNTDPALADRLTMDADTARRTVRTADMRALLMMVFHYTGDRYWLSDRFRPVRDIRLIAPEDAGLTDDVQAEIRGAAIEALSSTAAPALVEPDDDLLLEMMSVALGEKVPGEYVPMMREQMGFASGLKEFATLDATVTEQQPLPVLIVGAGESGIALGAMLNDLGIEYVIVERAGTVGGTWRDNIYPGCAVDTPNHSYSYSFGTRYPWSRYFSERAELNDYLQSCADEFNVRDRIRFNTTCAAAQWDGESSRWRVLLESDGRREWIDTRFFVSAIGPFGAPQIPDIPGLQTFSGTVTHSAQWPDGLDISGKSVAIIGTGASCMQIAPTIADDVAQLTIFQRTPQWIRPIERFHDRIDDDVQVLLQSEPFYSRWYRFVMLWRYGDGLLATLRKDPSWPHPERAVNKINDRHREMMTQHIHDVLGDRSDLIAKCVPSYPPYGKRILLDNGWYETLLKPNVHLSTERITAAEQSGVRTGDGALTEADIVVLATGFDVSRNASRLNITGRDGPRLDEVWAGGIGADLGITAHGFPNFFMVQGPTTGLAHGGSVIFTSETQARYIASTVHQALEAGITELEVKERAHLDYVERVDAEHDHLVWTHPGAVPYYRNAFGKVRTVLPWRMVDYFHLTRNPNLADYDVTVGDAIRDDASSLLGG